MDLDEHTRLNHRIEQIDTLTAWLDARAKGADDLLQQLGQERRSLSERLAGLELRHAYDEALLDG